MTPEMIHKYRGRTSAMDASPTNNVGWNYSFRCPVCKTTKPTAGRVERGWKKGYRCADCEALRLAKKALKAAAKLKQQAVSKT